MWRCRAEQPWQPALRQCRLRRLHSQCCAWLGAWRPASWAAACCSTLPAVREEHCLAVPDPSFLPVRISVRRYGRGAGFSYACGAACGSLPHHVPAQK